MAQINQNILILEDDGFFRDVLKGVCADFGQTAAVGDVESALSLITQQNYQLLLLDWHLVQPHKNSFYSAVDHFQPGVIQLALFTAPDLNNVITAMKTGVSDILWAAQEKEDLKARISESLAHSKPSAIPHSFVSRLAESLTDKAMVQKTSLFQARREFSRTFLHQILIQQKMRRSELANLMNVSPRTLHRHLAE